MGKMKEVFMEEREFENSHQDDDGYFYEKWKSSQQEPKNYPSGDEDFIDFVDVLPSRVRKYEDLDDSNEY
tara:strand:- start:563 stop:772 length:210 start_codon:yes stop_codon:yes gene_type:complete